MDPSFEMLGQSMEDEASPMGHSSASLLRRGFRSITAATTLLEGEDGMAQPGVEPGSLTNRVSMLTTTSVAKSVPIFRPGPYRDHFQHLGL